MGRTYFAEDLTDFGGGNKVSLGPEDFSLGVVPVQRMCEAHLHVSRY